LALQRCPTSRDPGKITQRVGAAEKLCAGCPHGGETAGALSLTGLSLHAAAVLGVQHRRAGAVALFTNMSDSIIGLNRIESDQNRIKSDLYRVVVATGMVDTAEARLRLHSALQSPARLRVASLTN